MKNTHAELPRVSWLGRPVKPMALGIILALTAIGFNGYTPIADTAGYDSPLSIIAFVSLILIMLSWVRRSQKIFEISLLLTAGLFTARAMGVALVVGHPLAGLLPLSVAVLAGGSYVLEKADEFHKWGK